MQIAEEFVTIGGHEFEFWAVHLLLFTEGELPHEIARKLLRSRSLTRRSRK